MSGVSLLLILNAMVYSYNRMTTWWRRAMWRLVSKHWGPVMPTPGQVRWRIMGVAQVLVCSVVVLGTQARLEPDRWWCAPSTVSALAITNPQVAAIDQLYGEGLSTQQRATEDVGGSMDDVVGRILDGTYDDDMLHATERLASAQVRQDELRRRSFERTAAVLTPRQRAQLTLRTASQRSALQFWEAVAVYGQSLVLSLLLGLTLGTGVELLRSRCRKA